MASLATAQIRFDHSHVLTLFRSYSPDLDPRVKQALVKNIAIALEVHTQLEEEIFYPALIRAGAGAEISDKYIPEHDEMRLLIKDLDALDPGGESYDGTVRQLMRETLHHVADEESVLLDQAERVLGPQLTTIGMRMSLRRADLLRARAGEVASNALQLAGVPLLMATRTLSRAMFGR